jgi:tetratricopeptide (TPR) repeat protein
LANGRTLLVLARTTSIKPGEDGGSSPLSSLSFQILLWYYQAAMSARAALLVVYLLSFISISSFCQATSSAQEQVSVHERLAQQYLSQQHPELAIPELKKIVELDPGNVNGRANLGVLLFFHGDYVNAIPQLQEALKLQPDLSKVRALLGMAEQRTGDFKSAQRDLEASFSSIQDQKLKVQVGLELVGIYTASSNLDDAAAVVTQLKKAYPDNAEVLYAAYRTYSDLSGESMLSLSMLAPDSAQMHQVMAHEEIREGNTNKAVAHFRKAIEINPHLPGVHYELAELLNTSLDATVKDDAEKEYRVAVKENPGDERAECRLGEIDAHKGNTSMAYEEFSRAVELQPQDSEARLGLAKVLIDLNQQDRAQSMLEETVKLDPTNDVAHYRLGNLYRQKGKIEDAKREVELYKKYKDMKEKLRSVYKDLQVVPSEIRSDALDAK